MIRALDCPQNIAVRPRYSHARYSDTSNIKKENFGIPAAVRRVRCRGYLDGVRRVGAIRMVAFNFSSAYTRQARMRKVALAIAGTEGALPDTYGLSLQNLADKMNDARETAANPQR